MIDTPEIIQTTTVPTARIRLTIPRSEIRNVMGPGIGELMAVLGAQGISPARTYRVTLLGDDDLMWVTEEKGKEVRYYQEPLSRFWPRLTLRCLFWLTPESML